MSAGTKRGSEGSSEERSQPCILKAASIGPLLFYNAGASRGVENLGS